MATRYRVARQSVRFCKQTYHKGEFLPESFSERDLYRVLYPSRIEKVEVPDEPVKEATSTEVPPTQTTPVVNTQGTNQAVKTPAAPTKTNGASLSGQSNVKK